MTKARQVLKEAYSGKNLQISLLTASILLALYVVAPTETYGENYISTIAPEETTQNVERVYYETPEEEEEKEVEVINLNLSE